MYVYKKLPFYLRIHVTIQRSYFHLDEFSSLKWFVIPFFADFSLQLTFYEFCATTTAHGDQITLFN